LVISKFDDESDDCLLRLKSMLEAMMAFECKGDGSIDEGDAVSILG